jgi:hypothetical protein
MASPGVWLSFEVECSETAHGETVRVVGGHDALGFWHPEKALHMTTSPESWPRWTSEPIHVGLDQVLHYKYIVCDESPFYASRWEGFAGNRNVELRDAEIKDGDKVQILSKWNETASMKKKVLPEKVKEVKDAAGGTPALSDYIRTPRTPKTPVSIRSGIEPETEPSPVKKQRPTATELPKLDAAEVVPTKCEVPTKELPKLDATEVVPTKCEMYNLETADAPYDDDVAATVEATNLEAVAAPYNDGVDATKAEAFKDDVTGKWMTLAENAKIKAAALKAKAIEAASDSKVLAFAENAKIKAAALKAKAIEAASDPKVQVTAASA